MTGNQDRRELRVYQTEIGGCVAGGFAPPEETMTEWLESTVTVGLEEWR